jgi:hypothetical protein
MLARCSAAAQILDFAVFGGCKSHTAHAQRQKKSWPFAPSSLGRPAATPNRSTLARRSEHAEAPSSLCQIPLRQRLSDSAAPKNPRIHVLPALLSAPTIRSRPRARPSGSFLKLVSLRFRLPPQPATNVIAFPLSSVSDLTLAWSESRRAVQRGSSYIVFESV